MYGIAAGIGAACVLLYMATDLVGEGILPGWVWPLSWVALSLIGAAVCGYLKPIRTWRWAVVVMAVQPLCLLLVGLVTGELLQQGRAAGGLIALVVFTVLSAVITPLAILASYVGARVGAKRLRASARA